MPSHTTKERAKNKGKKGLKITVEVKPIRRKPKKKK